MLLTKTALHHTFVVIFLGHTFTGEFPALIETRYLEIKLAGFFLLLLLPGFN